MDEVKKSKFNWDICGHEKIVHFLESAILGQGVAQAYLFCGPSHLGKQAVATVFISSLLCQEAKTARPCGLCYNCRQVKNNIHPDFYKVKREISDKTEKLSQGILIDQIRDLKAKLQQSTMLSGGYKIALITDAHLMNTHTANALLKILEEPTKKTIIILLVDDLSQLPATISSRCQIVRFLPVPSQTIKSYLENKGVFDAGLLSKQAHGRPGLALALADGPELVEMKKNNLQSFFQIMETALSDRFFLLDQLMDFEKDEAVNIARLESILSDWQLALRDMLLLRSDNEMLVANTNFLEKLKAQAMVWDFGQIKSRLKKINQAQDYLWHNISSKSSLENLIINL